MENNTKGVVTASVVLAVSYLISTLIIISSLKEMQSSSFAFVEKQKSAVGRFIEYQKEDIRNILSAQKQELRRIAASREGKLKGLIREELKNIDVDVKKDIK